ncbi:MAG TPA: pitrilysin family protein [Polyangiales bacterium]|nr:pitrilysin family protein [Polyangiales bacterium]
MKSLTRLSLLSMLAACGGSQASLPPAAQTTATQVVVERVEQTAPQKQPPPSGAAPREIHFPAIERQSTSSGLEVNTVALHGVPVVQIKLVIKSGSARDPKDLPGTAQLVAQMLKEGTTKRTSAKIAEAVDFLGARLSIHNDEEQITINLHALSEQLPEALALVAELATQPTFDEGELRKLKKRETDRLSLMSQSPNFLARREFWRHLYGDHPYAHIDTTKDVVQRIKRSDLASFHQRYFAPNNAYLVVVGDVAPEKVLESSNKAFQTWAKRTVPAIEYPAPPTRSAREIVLVDRPESVQSVIYMGNLSLARTSPDYVPLLVANQVLGGSAASRLFMDLREKQSLTYGAYSSVEEGLQSMPFRASAAVRNEVTPQAMKAFFDHLQRISSEAPTEGELADAKRLLVDSFPLHIETPGEIAGLVSDLRAYNFPDNYWDGFRSQIQAVTSPQALQAAKQFIRPDTALIVVVGRAAAVREPLASYGAVKVIDTDGKLVVATPAPATAATAPTTTMSSPPAQPAASAAHPVVPVTKPEPPKDAK